MVLETPLVAPELLGEPFSRLVKAEICIGIGTTHFEDSTAVDMECDIRLEGMAAPGHGHVAGKSAVKIFLHGAGHSLVDAGAKRLTDVDILAGYLE
jgi:hypothetical protein